MSGGAAGGLLERFQRDHAARRRLIDVLRSQALIGGDARLAELVANAAQLRELEAGEILIDQDAADNDLFFILAGSFRVLVNGRAVAERKVGQHVGEMAIVDPSSRRTSTVVASVQSIVARLDEPTFRSLADEHPRIWQAVALELCRRLDERKKFHTTPNTKPVLFVGSSRESLSLAEAFKGAIPDGVAAVVLWSVGVFGASSFPVEALEAQLAIADFALLVGAGDDQVTSRGASSSAPRDNVIFELGLFMGALSRKRAFLLVPHGEPLKLPSDLLGMTPLYYEPKASDHVSAVAAAALELIEIIITNGPK